ncbi:MAG: hypothetical protein WAV41_00785 [Microgenomates group bacterium]
MNSVKFLNSVKFSQFFPAIFLMFMGTVGSGIFVLPYLFSQSNFIFASVFLVFLTIITAVLNQFYVAIVTTTAGDHQLSGYAQKYLGHRFGLLASLNLLILAFGAILAYSKLFSGFTLVVFPNFSIYLISFLYLLIIFVLFYFHQILSKNIFLLIPIFILVVPIFLYFYSFNYPLLTINYSLSITPSFSFFGPLLFALSGFTIIPEVRETLGTPKKLSLVVTLGLLLVAIIYFLFAFSIIRLSGDSLNIDSVTGLATSFPLLAKLIAIFGMVITLRSTVNFMVILRELFYRDLKVSLPIANLLPSLFPLLGLLLTTVSLLTVISLTGHFTIFVSALVICLIRLRLPHSFWTEFWAILIMLTLTLGLVIAL